MTQPESPGEVQEERGGTYGAGAGRGGCEHPTGLLQEAEVIKAGWGLWEMQTQGLQ